ncbi:ATP-binding protein [Fuerstiella marisgermanici]|nr:ATP-binding protein [Fuerstiella marisgermanici]
MYVAREDLEKALRDGLNSQQHLIVHGESGTGKSWLYKKVLADLKVYFEVANLANASRLGSITNELRNLVSRDGKAEKTGYSESKSAGFDALAAKAALDHTGQYEYGQKEPFEACLSAIRCRAGKRKGILVLDNLEAAFTDAFLKELADLLILCDDERYAEYGVKILIVGVPGGVREYYYKTPHHATVANRLRELPEVSRLTREQCTSLAKKGFEQALGYTVESPSAVYAHIAWVTDRIPQMIHEYCLEVANLVHKSDRVITTESLNKADELWLAQSMYHGYSVVEQHMNERDTKAGRRNQTLFSLGCTDREQVKASDIEDVIRRQFPNSTRDTTLNVTQILAQLAKGGQPVLKRTPKGDAYTFADPRYRMALRAMLTKSTEERVEKVPLANT